MEFRNSDIFEELEDGNIPPSSLLDKSKEYVEADLTLEDFKNTIVLWSQEHRNTGKGIDKDANKFFAFADKFIEAKSERADFDKALNEYLSENPNMSFFEFLEIF